MSFLKSIHWVFLIPVFLIMTSGCAEHERWYKGNMHTHTNKYDGDSSPDDVVKWYADHDYDFLVITDHFMITGTEDLTHDLPKDFLLITGKEVSLTTGHIGVIDSKNEYFPPDWKMQPDQEAMLQQKAEALGKTEKEKRRWAKDFRITFELMQLIPKLLADDSIPVFHHPRGTFNAQVLTQFNTVPLLEIWNGITSGGILKLIKIPHFKDKINLDDPEGNEAKWDTMLEKGIAVYGTAADDAHDFQPPEISFKIRQERYEREKDRMTSNNIRQYEMEKQMGEKSASFARPGKAWVMVSAPELTTNAIKQSLRSGEFYASTGVELRNLRYNKEMQRVSFKILAEEGKTYTTRFIGGRYKVLKETTGLTPSYKRQGDEPYVRAKVTESPGVHAWTQPIFFDKDDQPYTL